MKTYDETIWRENCEQGCNAKMVLRKYEPRKKAAKKTFLSVIKSLFKKGK